jgi:cobalamin biosynthesis protein CobC
MRHGGDLGQASRHYGIAEAEWLDLSTGINPRPWPGSAELPPAELQLDRLPSAARLAELIAAARRTYGVPPGLGIAAAPGSEAIIRALPRLVPGRAALVATAYGSYAETWRAEGRALEPISPAEPALRDPEASVILVNPNNPDGRTLPPAEVLDFARHRRRGALLIVDEAFADAEDGVSVVPHLAEGDPVLALKSFGKFFGLPGLRLGFAVGQPALVERLTALLGDWPVSSAALAIGAPALADAAWQDEARRWLAEQTERLDAALGVARLAVAGGTRLFRLVRHAEAARLHRRLAEQGVWTRIWADAADLIRFGLPPDAAGLERLRQSLATARRG